MTSNVATQLYPSGQGGTKKTRLKIEKTLTTSARTHYNRSKSLRGRGCKKCSHEGAAMGMLCMCVPCCRNYGLHCKVGTGTMCDFHNFGLIFAGQMHCLPQISNGGCPKGTRSVEKVSNNVDFRL